MKNELTIFGRKISLKMFNSGPQQNQQTEMNKKFQKISDLLGREVNSESTLTSEELETLDTAFAENVVAPVQEVQPANEAPDLSETISAAVTEGIQPLQATIASLEARVAQVEGSPAASATEASPTAGVKAEIPSWADPNRDYGIPG